MSETFKIVLMTIGAIVGMMYVLSNAHDGAVADALEMVMPNQPSETN